MRGKAYRRLLSARRRPLLVLLLVVVVLVVWRVTVVVAPRWVGVEVMGLLLVCIAVSVAVSISRARRDDRWRWVDDPEFLDRLAAAVARRERQAGR